MARTEDTIARLSGDEFVLVCERTHTGTAVEVAGRLTSSIGGSYLLPEGIAKVTASIGVATGDGTCGADELLRRSDAAMYSAKKRGPGAVYTGQRASASASGSAWATTPDST